MATVHMTESDVARDLHAVLSVVQKGTEVVIEQDDKPVAVLRPARSGRKISECIASALTEGSQATLDGGFAEDVEQGIKNRQAAWTPPSWD